MKPASFTFRRPTILTAVLVRLLPFNAFSLITYWYLGSKAVNSRLNCDHLTIHSMRFSCSNTAQVT